MEQRFRWLGLMMVAVSIAVGVLAYQAGVSHGLAVTAPGAGGGAPAVARYYWYPWFGFFPFGIFIWIFVLRFLFWGGPRRRWYYRHGPWGGPYDGPYEDPRSFDDWHRRAHERMNNQPGNENSPGR
jgi:hypothetical protein